ncbi:hypothetical protein [Sorangium sp. So ce590]|uniref:hypothetical protein n=1 Tax=unclassified Sorangium TaxID=2621164 RepID=UPI003F631DC8
MTDRSPPRAARPPHPALSTRSAPPHPATVAQRKEAPHPATVAQRKEAPHPATVAQRSTRYAATTGPAAGARAVQRKIGFEFETNWVVKGPITMKKGMVFFRGKGWEATGDEHHDYNNPRAARVHEELKVSFMQTKRKYGKFMALEFNILPLEEDDQEGLRAVFEDLDLFIKALIKERSKDRKTPASRISGFTRGDVDEKALAGYTFDSRKLPLQGNPQLTAGIQRGRTLAALREMTEKNSPLLGHMTEASYRIEGILDRAKTVAKGYRAAYRSAYLDAVHVHHGQAMPSLDEVEAACESLIALLAIYVAETFRNVRYKEHPKDFVPILSRTAPAAFPILDIVPPAAIAHGVCEAAGVQPNASLPLHKRIGKEYKASALVEEVLLVAQKYRYVFEQQADWKRWEPQEVGPRGHRSVGHVYELRSLAREVPYQKWLPVALELAGKISAINRGGADDKKAPAPTGAT